MRILVAFVVLFLPGVLLAPVWHLAGLGAEEDDILYYYPTRVFFHDTIRAGEWPWFNPWTGLGRPFAADPQTATWYPTTWLFAVMPPLWAYPLSLWLHYSLGLWGMYRLLRSTALSRQAALFGGIAFAFCGFMLAHRAHFTIQHAAAWTPWVLWRLHRYTLAGTDAGLNHRTRAPCRLFEAALVIALQSLAGHVQASALTALGSLVFLFARGPGLPVPRVQVAVRWLIAWICAAGLFALQWLPTLDYTSLCTRAQRRYWDFVENSWSPSSALGWLLPMIYGQRTPNFFDQPYWGLSHQVEQFAYMGILPLLLALLALRGGWRFDPRRRPWVILALFGVLLSLGQFGPICPILFWIPGSTLFRCPARGMLLVNLAVAALAAVTLHDLGPQLSPHCARLRAAVLRWTSRPRLLALLLVGIPLALILAVLPFIDADYRWAAFSALRPWSTAVLVPLLLILTSLLMLRLAVRRWQQPRLTWLLLLVTAVDLGIIGWTIDVPVDRGTATDLITPQGDTDWMNLVRESDQRLWIVTKRQGRKPGEYIDSLEKVAANTNILRQIATLTDYGPLQPRAIVERFAFSFWGETDDTLALLADTSWMRPYNVGWILCDDDWPAPADCDLELTTDRGWRLYRGPDAAGFAVFENAAQPGAVRYARTSSSSFTIWADTWPTKASSNHRTTTVPDARPILLVSQLALPGWTASLNGQPARILTLPGGLFGVHVPPGGPVEITCSYFPPGLVPGAIISALSTLVLLTSAVWGLRRHQSLPP